MSMNQRAAFIEELVHWRRYLHTHPELGHAELRTAAFVADKLQSFGLTVHRGVGGTGVVATLSGARGEGRSIALRADMDALPIRERALHDHVSEVEGCMHACGHDGHTTILLGAARQLAEHPDFAGLVHFVFQPAEELIDSGARAMMAAGLFSRFPHDAIYGIHNLPSLALGTAGVRPGVILAAADVFEIRIKGRGGHAAFPQLAVDPIPVACDIVGALQRLVSRRISPFDAAVVSITAIEAGSAFNVIPETVLLRGTVRTLREETRILIQQEQQQICSGIAQGNGCSVEVAYTRGHPATVNHEREAEIARRALESVLGAKQVIGDIEPLMGGEDFAYYLQGKPGAFVLLGQGDEDHQASLHCPQYDFNDRVIPLGVEFFMAVVRAELG